MRRPIYYIEDGDIILHPLCGNEPDSRLELNSGKLQWRAYTGTIVWQIPVPQQGVLFRAWVNGCYVMDIPYTTIDQEELERHVALCQRNSRWQIENAEFVLVVFAAERKGYFISQEIKDSQLRDR